MNDIKYLTVCSRDEEWGIIVTTVGKQEVEPKSSYPPTLHPTSHNFTPQSGRVLDEYQLVYITAGEGTFESQSCRLQTIKAGTVIMLFPGEWHSYHPSNETGWQEHWVGFKGSHIDKRIENSFFTPSTPIFEIGISSTIIDMYNSILSYAQRESIGYQQVTSSIVLHILGYIFYKDINKSSSNRQIVNKIDEARDIMRKNRANPPSVVEISEELNIGYTWFRRMFKKYTGTTPAQYQIQQRLLMAKELLSTTDLNVNEIAYMMNFENGSQFATFFKRLESITPSTFRERTRKQSKVVDTTK